MLVGNVSFPIPLQIYTDFALMQVKSRENGCFVDNFNILLTSSDEKGCFLLTSVIIGV